MKTKYQVYADFKLTKGKPSLVKTSLYSTTEAATTLPFFPYIKTFLTTSRIFRTLPEAQHYIAYLHGVYKNPAPLPVLDSEQQKLFPEVQNEIL